MVYKCFYKNSASGIVTSADKFAIECQIMANQQLAEGLHKATRYSKNWKTEGIHIF